MGELLRTLDEIPIGEVSAEDRRIMEAAYRQPVYHYPEPLSSSAPGYLKKLSEVAGVSKPFLDSQYSDLNYR